MVEQLQYKLDEVSQVVKRVLPLLKERRILLLKGDLGAGKTTLVNGILEALGAEEGNSPTFSLVNEYPTDIGVVYHLDLYRLNDPEEAFDFGIEDLLYGDELLIIEWPEIIENLLPDNCVYCNITHLNNEQRQINIEL